MRNELVKSIVEFGTILQRPRNDERRTRFVNQDRVDLVNNRKAMPALDHLVLVHLHIVAQVVEAEFVVGPVGHITGVLRLALVVVQIMYDAADGKT